MELMGWLMRGTSWFPMLQATELIGVDWHEAQFK